MATAKHNHKARSSDEESWGCVLVCEFTMALVIILLLLGGALGLVLYWVIAHRDGFAWQEDPGKEFNLHPVLMIAGFIFFSGIGLVLYRACRCCKRIYVKLLHTACHALAIPCVVVGFLAVLDSHNLRQPPINNFYSLHSWMGLTTMGLFGLQFVVGFFTFLILLCCEGPTSAFRASMVPLHSTFGITTFFLAIATSLTGLTEKAFFSISDYDELPEEGIVVNALGCVLTALAIAMPYFLYREGLRYRDHLLVSANTDL